MDFISHLGTEGGVHHSMTGQRAFACKRVTDDHSLKMNAIFTCNLNFGAGYSGANHLLYRCAIHRLFVPLLNGPDIGPDSNYDIALRAGRCQAPFRSSVHPELPAKTHDKSSMAL